MAEEGNEVPEQPSTDGLLSVRALGIIMAGIVIGAGVGVLRYLSGQPVPDAIVEGLIASGATIAGLHRLVERSQRRRHRADLAVCAHTLAESRPVPDPDEWTETAGDEVQQAGETTAELGERLKEAVADEPDPTT